jgi:colanic acid biosynthesis glycosyl transferase WcaI
VNPFEDGMTSDAFAYGGRPPAPPDGRKIVFVNRYYAPDHSATSQILTDLAEHLARENFRVHVICGDETYDGRAGLPPQETLNGVEIHRVTSLGLGRASLLRRGGDAASLYAAMYREACRVLRRGDILVAKTDPPLLSVPMARVAKRRGALLINWLQDLYPEVAAGLGVGLARGSVGGVLTHLRDRSLKAAAVNVVIGELMRARLIAGGVHPASVALIQNWAIEDGIIPVAPEDNPLRREWGLHDKLVVGYSGNLGRAHEFATLLDAAELLRDRDDLAYLFIGGGHHVEQLKQETLARGLMDRFHFRPYQDRARLSQSLSAPDVHWVSLRPELEGLIVPSKFYGIAAAGRPTLAIARPGGEIPALLQKYECGLQATPGRPDQAAAAIRQLAEPDYRARLGRNAYAASRGELSKAFALQVWVNLLTHDLASAQEP